MWSWDQGRLDYFQFDNLKKIAKFALTHDLRLTNRTTLAYATGLRFLPDNEQYPPWRNYSRVFGLSLICAKHGLGSRPTRVAMALAEDGAITADEYFHFLCQATTDPSPALQGWDAARRMRYPLLFTLKFLLARASLGLDTTNFNEIVGGYAVSGFTGNESYDDFVALTQAGHIATSVERQAAESIQVISQISYLSLAGRNVAVSLSKDQALKTFGRLAPLDGQPKADGAEEVFRITDMFAAAVDRLEMDYASTDLSDIEEAGFSPTTTFAEGAKTRKTHLVIERNSKIRSEFFRVKPSSSCDFCSIDTAKSYPWTPRILDVHHLLPLCSGARTSTNGTLLDDLVAICPTCHRAVHRFYDSWLKEAGQKDFLDADQAKMVYDKAKTLFKAGM